MKRLRKVAFVVCAVMGWLDLAATIFLAGAGKLAPSVVAAVLLIVLMATAIFLDPARAQAAEKSGSTMNTGRGRLNRVLTDHDHAESDRLWAEFEQPWEQAEWDG